MSLIDYEDTEIFNILSLLPSSGEQEKKHFVSYIIHMQKYQLILIPDWLGSTKKSGVELGPRKLKDSILTSPIKTHLQKEIIKVGIPKPNSSHLVGEYKTTKYLPEMKAVCIEAKKKIIQVIESKNVPIVLMGDDSSMMGVLPAIAHKYTNDYGLVWLDAHGDINTPETSPSGCLYGMSIAHMLGYGHRELTALNGKYPSLRSENLIMLGQRALDKEEIRFINSKNIFIYNSIVINKLSAKQIVKNIILRFEAHQISKIFIHVDLDVLDPKKSPGVTLKEKNGISTKKVLEITSYLFQYGKIIGLSIAEYNPKEDKKNKTLNAAYKIVEGYIKSI